MSRGQRKPQVRHCEEHLRRSNPGFLRGFLDCFARNDGERPAEALAPRQSRALWLPSLSPRVAVEAAVDPGAVAVEADGAAFGVALPGLLQSAEFGPVQRRANA